MGFLDFLTGNKVRKSNNEKIARVKRELSFMPRSRKIEMIRAKGNSALFDTRYSMIDDIYECDSALTSDFLTYYFLFEDKELCIEAEYEDGVQPRDAKGRFCKRK
jgi:hypothetical protein